MKREAVAILSGGLDSMLAVRVVLDQGVPVTGLHFMTQFSCESMGVGRCGHDFDRLLEMWGPMGFGLRRVSLGEEYVDLIRNPRFGYGKNMNPCIDCKIMFLGLAKKVMEERDACCVVTGEVLNQRPMSQNRAELNRIAKMSGLKGMILRPLTAKRLTPTIAEEQGLIDREKLLGFAGRGRKPQYELAAKYGIENIPQPAGGCLLTDPIYSARLYELWKHQPKADLNDIYLLRVGRHFRPASGVKIIVGRNEKDNDRIEQLAREGDALLRLKDFVGPMTLVPAGHAKGDLELAASLTVRYGDAPDKKNGTQYDVVVEGEGRSPETLRASSIPDDELQRLRGN